MRYRVLFLLLQDDKIILSPELMYIIIMTNDKMMSTQISIVTAAHVAMDLMLLL